MRRREFLLGGGAALGLSAFPMQWVRAAGKKRQRVLYFTRSGGFEHSAVKRKGDEPAFSEKVLVEMGKRAGFDVVCSKDGTLFDQDLGQWDAVAFYTSGDLTRPDDPQRPVNGGAPPMSPAGKQRLLATIAAGKLGFVGFHSANDSFHSTKPQPEQWDPYIKMVGGEFISHGPQQEATLKLTSPNFPGTAGVPKQWRLNEEWYSLKYFARDLHVILVQETAGMKGDTYDRPSYPATWARMHEKGRVYYTSFGHRDDIWTNPLVQQVILGGFAWVMRNVDADVTPNVAQVTPGAWEMPKFKPKPKVEAKK
jgi:uncharacterized protein